ncbi:GIY-YIG nuclease family protein [Sphingomonas sp. JC676]|uniref:GIY-YIG nuclease family protein n=1 Tax=Sphingomonas sp. JC676 TaxID=2768065 RepID=UPI001657C1A7|nr:GIY-YIG nuclease family protein [Sphingomonas sp. JC676]MBC9031794.1 GIY-YIG nuclease family protein [Sphingomonas sp. JC676]
MERTPVVYIVASQRNGTIYTGIYTGVTSDLAGRIYQHRTGIPEGFTAKHRCKILVWYEVHSEMESAIVREKRIKEWKRQWKLRLIEQENPTWRDLAIDLGFEPLDVNGE